MGTEGSGTSATPKKGINAMLAVVISFIVIYNTDVIEIMQVYLSKMGLIFVIVLFGMLLFGLFGGKTGGFTGIWLVVFFILTIFAVVWAVSPDLGFDFFRYNGFLSDRNGFEIVAGLLGLAITLAIIFGAIGAPDNSRRKGIKDTFGELGS